MIQGEFALVRQPEHVLDDESLIGVFEAILHVADEFIDVQVLFDYEQLDVDV